MKEIISVTARPSRHSQPLQIYYTENAPRLLCFSSVFATFLRFNSCGSHCSSIHRCRRLDYNKNATSQLFFKQERMKVLLQLKNLSHATLLNSINFEIARYIKELTILVTFNITGPITYSLFRY